MTRDQLKKLENDLWSAADKLRANSDLKASEYSTPVLGLIFLKFADNKYRQHEAAIKQEYHQHKGKRTERLESTYAEYYQILEQATFDKPVVYMFDEQGEAEWKVTAETGVLNTDDNVILRDKVHLDGLLPASFISPLDTPYLELDLVTQDVRSNQHLSIVGQEFQTEGVGLKGHLERKYFELLDKGHATYFNEKR